MKKLFLLQKLLKRWSEDKTNLIYVSDCSKSYLEASVRFYEDYGYEVASDLIFKDGHFKQYGYWMKRRK